MPSCCVSARSAAPSARERTTLSSAASFSTDRVRSANWLATISVSSRATFSLAGILGGRDHKVTLREGSGSPGSSTRSGTDRRSARPSAARARSRPRRDGGRTRSARSAAVVHQRRGPARTRQPARPRLVPRRRVRPVREDCDRTSSPPQARSTLCSLRSSRRTRRSSTRKRDFPRLSRYGDRRSSG
jgi:hypothetical protein